ncbi:MAG: hypothetical protein HKM89_06010 [Gemmatimonadales bacterium]|nr:hypothetical protein [Gemmatimonadales bacterium]
MLAHLLGTLATLAVFGLVGIALLWGLIAFRRGRRSAALRALATAGAAVTLYGLGIALPALLSKTRVLEPSRELSFCGFDCHLHVTVLAAQAERASEPGASTRVVIGVQVRSDAVQAPEHPSLLRFRLVDQRGREYPPAAYDTGLPPFTQDLAAGESYSRTLSFVVPADAETFGLRVTWRGWFDYWVLGPAGTFVKRKTLLALPMPSG